MTPNVVLIQTPITDFTTLLTVTKQALGYNVVASVDASPVQRTDAERFLSCLASMQDRDAKPGLAPHLLSHVSFSLLIAADDTDTLPILSVTEMPFVVVDTRVRGVQLAIVSGTLAAWHDAVKHGSSRYVSASVRLAFNRIREVFIAANINVWKDCSVIRQTDGTLLLEDKR